MWLGTKTVLSVWYGYGTLVLVDNARYPYLEGVVLDYLIIYICLYHAYVMRVYRCGSNNASCMRCDIKHVEVRAAQRLDRLGM